jgi:hypothetical protein
MFFLIRSRPQNTWSDQPKLKCESQMYTILSCLVDCIMERSISPMAVASSCPAAAINSPNCKICRTQITIQPS